MEVVKVERISESNKLIRRQSEDKLSATSGEDSDAGSAAEAKGTEGEQALREIKDGKTYNETTLHRARKIMEKVPHRNQVMI